MSVASMTFELSNILIFFLTFCSNHISKFKNHSLECFLYLKIAFKGWFMFSDKGSKFSRIILRLITAFEKKSFSSIATSSSFVIRVLSSSASFTLSENRTLFDRKGLTDFPEAFVFSYICAFHLNLYNIFQNIKKYAFF